VREGVLVGFLTPVVASPVAASLVVLVRLVTVVTDILFVGLVEGLGLFTGRAARRSLSASILDNERGVVTPTDQTGR
jgi:hypothetical protein